MMTTDERKGAGKDRRPDETAAERQARMAKALRENLKRRKAQQRGRAALERDTAQLPDAERR